MRYLFCLILLLSTLSCSLFFSHESDSTLEPATSSQGELQLVVDSSCLPLLTGSKYSTEEFPLTLSYDSQQSSSGTISLRGNASLSERLKSYSIDLRREGNIVVDTVGIDRFAAISIASPERLVLTILGLTFAVEQWLFLPKFTLSRAVINSIDLGTYILIEHNVNAFCRNDNTTEFVMRRRNGTNYDIKYYKSHSSVKNLTRGTYSRHYETLHTLGSLLSEEELYRELKGRMDIDGYFRMIALNTVLQNGDYSDEVFYGGVPKWDGEQFRPYLTFSVWDYNELFSVPHRGNYSEGSLIFCNENRFDQMIEEDLFLYQKYLIELSLLVHEMLSPDYLDSIEQKIKGCYTVAAGENGILLNNRMYSVEEIDDVLRSYITQIRERCTLLSNAVQEQVR